MVSPGSTGGSLPVMDGGAALSKTYPAVADSVPRARTDLTVLAVAAGAGEDAVESIRLAASEALTNAVRHAYPDGPGEVHVTAAMTGDELWLLVADDGCGLRSGSHNPGLGVGLALIACAADHFSVVKRANGGTEIQMRFEIGAGGTPDRDQFRGSVLSATSPA
jgi:anti-sigma regulatory factor (Ser/Thr protein kinase)